MSKRLRRIVVAVVALAALLALGPTIASYPPMRGWVLKAIVPPLDGSVLADDARFAWLDTQSVEGLTLRDAGREQLVTVERIDIDRRLLDLLLDRRTLGTIQVRDPHVHLIVAADGTNNLQRAFARALTAPPGQGVPNVALDVQGAKFSWQIAPSNQAWSVELGPVRTRIQNDVPGVQGPLLTVEPTTILDNVELSQGLCRDVLTYIAPPLLSKVTAASGRVSMKIDEGRYPLNDPRSGTIAGQLLLHTVQIGSDGPIVKKIAEWLQVPNQIQLAHEATVRFQQTGRRMYHEGLEFGIGPARVRTQGSVGLDDESLDLVAVVELRLSPDAVRDKPLLSALSAHPFEIPIRGTLQQPEVDLSALSDPAMAVLLETLHNLDQRLGASGGAEALVGNVLGTIQGDAPPEDTVPAIVGQSLNLLEQAVAERRRQAQQAAERGETPPPPRRPILGRLLNRALDEAQKAVEP